jgi:hypothetical protein
MPDRPTHVDQVRDMRGADRFREVRSQNLANELVLGQSERTRHQSFTLIVEGPDDVRVFNGLTCPRRCVIRHVEGKRQVIEQVGKAIRWGQSCRKDVSRFLGIIDRDFDGHDEPLPARIAFLSRRFTDLESVVLAYRGDQIVGDLVHRSALNPDRGEWLFSRAADGTCLKRLVGEVVAPCGALRNNWPPALGRFNQDLIDDLLRLRLTGGVLDAKSIEQALTRRIQDDQIARRLADSAAHMIRSCADPWKLVRGKDLVQAVARYLTSERGLYLYAREPAIEAQYRIRNIALALFDHDVLRGAGTAQLADDALEPFGESSAEFLAGSP